MENGTINMIGTTILGNCNITEKGDITDYLFKSLKRNIIILQVHFTININCYHIDNQL